MYENKYGSGRTTYSIAKRNYKEDKFVAWVVRSVRKDTAEAVWYDTVIDRP